MNGLSQWLIAASTTYPHLVYAATVVLACAEGPILSVIFGFLLQLGYFNFYLVMAALMVGDLLGDVIWYGVGRYWGHKFIRRFGKYIGATEERVVRVTEVFHKHKDPILLISKMTNGFGFALVTLMTAGMTKIPFRRYLGLNLVGQFVWTGILLAAGYFFGNFFDMIDKAFGRLSAVSIGVFVILGVVIVFRTVMGKVSERLAGKKEREERMAAAFPVEPKTFFTVVIPAHNEEGYIGETLRVLHDIDYPRHLYEVLVVENGSNDNTVNAVMPHVSPNVRLMDSERGASKAKNKGIRHASPKSDWIILLDADTHLKKNFFKELDAYLVANADKHYSVGTTTVLPQGKKRFKADAWFAFYNWGHRLSDTSFSIQIMNAHQRDHVHFDETIHFAEDLKFIRDLKKHGAFFYFDTRQVTTSTRRFDSVGWWKLYFIWLWQSQVLARFEKKKKGDYTVVR